MQGNGEQNTLETQEKGSVRNIPDAIVQPLHTLPHAKNTDPLKNTRYGTSTTCAQPDSNNQKNQGQEMLLKSPSEMDSSQDPVGVQSVEQQKNHMPIMQTTTEGSMSNGSVHLATQKKMRTIIAIDPGTTQSAFLHWDGERMLYPSIVPNEQMIKTLCIATANTDLCIEMVASYGMSVGREVFETCVWIGEFKRQWKITTRRDARLIYRRDVKLHHCASAKAKDANIRQALIDKYGKPWTWNVLDPNKPATGKNRMKVEGVTFGLHDDLWAAFALATYASETSGAAA